MHACTFAQIHIHTCLRCKYLLCFDIWCASCSCLLYMTCYRMNCTKLNVSTNQWWIKDLEVSNICLYYRTHSVSKMFIIWNQIITYSTQVQVMHLCILPVSPVDCAVWCSVFGGGMIIQWWSLPTVILCLDTSLICAASVFACYYWHV